MCVCVCVRVCVRVYAVAVEFCVLLGYCKGVCVVARCFPPVWCLHSVLYPSVGTVIVKNQLLKMCFYDCYGLVL